MSTLKQLMAAGTVLLGLAATSPAFAVDGVVLIDQNRALAGNVSPGDTAGFPVRLSTPGSYRLSGNLTVPPGVTGILIAANDVTLHLNGFSISTSGGGAAAIASEGDAARQFIDITHGMLRGFGTGLTMINSSHVTVRDLRSTNVSGVSIVTGPHSIVQRNTVQGLIQVECPSVITENITEGFLTVLLTGPSAPSCVRWNNRSLTFTDPVTQ